MTGHPAKVTNVWDEKLTVHQLQFNKTSMCCGGGGIGDGDISPTVGLDANDASDAYIISPTLRDLPNDHTVEAGLHEQWRGGTAAVNYDAHCDSEARQALVHSTPVRTTPSSHTRGVGGYGGQRHCRGRHPIPLVLADPPPTGILALLLRVAGSSIRLRFCFPGRKQRMHCCKIEWSTTQRKRRRWRWEFQKKADVACLPGAGLLQTP
eukprot:gene11748-biopygen1462